MLKKLYLPFLLLLSCVLPASCVKDSSFEKSCVFVDVFSPESAIAFRYQHQLGFLSTQGRLRSCGVVVSTKPAIIMVVNPLFLVNEVSKIEVTFFDKSSLTAELLYTDPVLGISLLKVASIPSGVTSLPIAEDFSEKTFLVREDMGFSVAQKGLLVEDAAGQGFLSWSHEEGAEVRVPKGVVFSEDKKIIGFTVERIFHTRDSKTQLVAEAFGMKKPLACACRGQAYERRFCGIAMSAVPLTYLGYCGLVPKDMDVPQVEAVVVLESKKGLEINDVILKINGKRPSLYVLQRESSDRETVKIEYLRNGEKKTLDLKTDVFPEDKEGVIVTQDFKAFFITPFLQRVMIPEGDINSLVFVKSVPRSSNFVTLTSYERDWCVVRNVPEDISLQKVYDILKERKPWFLSSWPRLFMPHNKLVFVKKEEEVGK